MQKNKFIHEDIKAVCSSATKKLIAAGLIAATTVGGANFASNNCKNIACAQLPEGNELNKPEEKKLRYLTEEEEMEVIAKGLGNYSSWGDLCADNNFAYGSCFFEEDAKRLMSLINARTDEIERNFEKLKVETDKKRATMLAYYERKPGGDKWEFTDDNYLNIDEASAQRFGSLPPEIHNAAHDAYALRHKLDYLRERIREYNGRLEGGLLSFVIYSRRYNQVEASLQPQSPEPDRYDIELAPEYVEWATREVNRLEALARAMLQQLHVNDQEQIDFENRVRWLNPEDGYAMLTYMSEEDSLDKFFDMARQLDQLEVDINQQTEEIRRNDEELTEMQQNLKHIMDENLAFFSQPYESPFNNNQVQNDNNMINNNQIDIDDSITITREEFERNIPGNQLRGEGILVERPEHNNQIDDYQTKNDNNMINNNQIEEIVEIQEVVEEPEDLNMINNNQIEEIQEIQEVTNEQDNNNLINNNQQQQPILHIAPLNVPAPQQRNGIVGGTIKFIGNAVSFFNPFSKK